MVELSLLEGGQYSSEIKVGPPATVSDEEQELMAKFVPFPVCLAGDKELVWLFARAKISRLKKPPSRFPRWRRTLGLETGQKLLRDRVERRFPGIHRPSPQ